jgi:hypothetical protein
MGIGHWALLIGAFKEPPRRQERQEKSAKSCSALVLGIAAGVGDC